MKFFMDFVAASLNKVGEELCGDKVEWMSDTHYFIAVLSDGLGSGVKANILSTLTSKIAMTMPKEGLPLEEVVDTLVHTLPICSVRKLAYSTFTMMKIDEDGMAYVVEFDNPAHQNLDFPQAFSIKLNILYKLEKVLVALGKVVELEMV